MTSLDVSGEGRDSPSALARWLGLSPTDSDNRIVWVHRANCYTDFGKDYVCQHCSCKFIHRVISTIRPRLIITLGRLAAEWFLQFDKLHDVVGNRTKYTHDGVDYPCVVFFHPSSARWWKEYEDQHERVIRVAKTLLKE